MFEIFLTIISITCIYFLFLYKKSLKPVVRIAFGCEDRVGKDTACDYLKNKRGGVILSFATPLYKSLYSTQKIFELEQKKDRDYLLMVGAWARGHDPLIFINLLLNKVKECSDQNIYISDLRFENEYNAVLQNKFATVRIVREKSSASIKELVDHHWDYVIENNGNVKEFYEKLDEVYDDIEKNLI